MKILMHPAFVALLCVSTLAPSLSFAADGCSTLDSVLREKMQLAGKVKLQKLIVSQTESAIDDAVTARGWRWAETVAGVVTIAVTYGASYANFDGTNGFSIIKQALKESPSFYAFAGAGIAATADGAINIHLANVSLNQLRPKLEKQNIALQSLENSYKEKVQDLQLAMKQLGCPFTVTSTQPVDLGSELKVMIENK
jgi:hypothetical protein